MLYSYKRASEFRMYSNKLTCTAHALKVYNLYYKHGAKVLLENNGHLIKKLTICSDLKKDYIYTYRRLK